MIKLNFLRAGDFVTLLEDSSHKGKVLRYLGFNISPKGRGRIYQIQWIEPTRSIGDYYDFELKLIDGTFQLKERPK